MSFLFKRDVPPTSDVAPSVGDNFETKPKDVSSMSQSELEAEIKRLDSAEKGVN